MARLQHSSIIYLETARAHAYGILDIHTIIIQNSSKTESYSLGGARLAFILVSKFNDSCHWTRLRRDLLKSDNIFLRKALFSSGLLYLVSARAFCAPRLDAELCDKLIFYPLL